MSADSVRFFPYAAILAAFLIVPSALASSITVSGSAYGLDTANCGIPSYPQLICNVGLDDQTPPFASGTFQFSFELQAPILPEGSDAEVATLKFSAIAGSDNDGPVHVSSTLLTMEAGALICTDPSFSGAGLIGAQPAEGEVRFTPCRSPDAQYLISFSGVNSMWTDVPLPAGPRDTFLLEEFVNYTFTEDYLAPGEAPEPASFTALIAGVLGLLWLVRARQRPELFLKRW